MGAAGCMCVARTLRAACRSVFEVRVGVRHRRGAIGRLEPVGCTVVVNIKVFRLRRPDSAPLGHMQSPTLASQHPEARRRRVSKGNPGTKSTQLKVTCTKRVTK